MVLNLRAFTITETELKLIARAAIIGESSIPKDTIVSQLTSDGSSVMLINRNGIINYFSLQPKGQDLIDKAKNLVETNTQLQ